MEGLDTGRDSDGETDTLRWLEAELADVWARGESGSGLNGLQRDSRTHSAVTREAFVIVSNDSDLTEPMRIVCYELGMVVGILNPQPP